MRKAIDRSFNKIIHSGFTPDVNVWEVVFSKSGEFKTVAKAFDLAGHTSGVHDFGFSADTSHMATVSKDGTYRFYNTKSTVTISQNVGSKRMKLLRNAFVFFQSNSRRERIRTF